MRGIAAGDPARGEGVGEGCRLRASQASAVSASAVGAAVTAGLGVAALARPVAPSGAPEVGAEVGLPPLPPSEVMLHARDQGARAAGALRLIAGAFRAAPG